MLRTFALLTAPIITKRCLALHTKHRICVVQICENWLDQKKTCLLDCDNFSIYTRASLITLYTQPPLQTGRRAATHIRLCVVQLLLAHAWSQYLMHGSRQPPHIKSVVALRLPQEIHVRLIADRFTCMQRGINRWRCEVLCTTWPRKHSIRFHPRENTKQTIFFFPLSC